jgi:hypothetical protein
VEAVDNGLCYPPTRLLCYGGTTTNVEYNIVLDRKGGRMKNKQTKNQGPLT